MTHQASLKAWCVWYPELSGGIHWLLSPMKQSMISSFLRGRSLHDLAGIDLQTV